MKSENRAKPKNFLYKDTQGGTVVTPEEHEYITSKVEAGHTSIYIRNKTYMINMLMCCGIKPTDIPIGDRSINLRDDDHLKMLQDPTLPLPNETDDQRARRLTRG